MKNLNPLKIGKYTFGVSFIIGNIFMFGSLFGAVIQNRNIAIGAAVWGFYYLGVAGIVNLVILSVLLIAGVISILGHSNEIGKQCFIGISIILINIPLAILHTFLGLSFFKLF